MNRSSRHLRTRLLVAMVTIALGVLALTALVTTGLARRTETDAARRAVDARAAVIAPEFDKLLRQAPNARALLQTPGGRREIQRIRDLLVTTLRASNGGLVGIDRNGQVQEVLGPLIGAGSATPTLPDGVSARELDAQALLARRTQQATAGDTVFTAVPLTPTAGGVTPVVVLTEAINARPFGNNGGVVLAAALVALALAALVAAYLARRMTKPLAAMEATARSIASGDLTARVDTTHVSDDELGSLAGAINVMAIELDAARGHERAFLLSVSHDLRTPLTSIRGYAEAIADGTVVGMDARIRAANVISSESNRLERLVADLLDLARLDAHQFSLHPASIDAGTVVADTVEAFQPAAADLGLALELALDGALPAFADAQRLAQIVANLVENALKFATSRVTVGAHAAGDTIEVWVEDDGPGIAPADLPRVFERLYTSRTVPGRTLGTGIGLAIVRELTHAMGGDARVLPVDSTGTRFVVGLPVSAAPA